MVKYRYYTVRYNYRTQKGPVFGIKIPCVINFVTLQGEYMYLCYSEQGVVQHV